jgi:glycosyltransferase involved in cell wall biosynthesis
VSSIVSVIVPTRNSAKTLEACLRSIRSQVYTPIELIVIDNQSSDLTLDIARRHADIVDSFGPERSAQRNRGARLAHGDYFLFVDSDMTLSRDVVVDCVDAVQSSEAPGVIIPEASIGEGFWARARALERRCYIGDDAIEAARFFSRSAFEKSGGFDETLVAMEDWDLSKRIADGRRLPRARSEIKHDEGRLRLANALAKKRYYGTASRLYWRKHGRPTLGQANLIFRPAFARNWRLLLQHPILTAGFLSLKSLESAAATLGAIEATTGNKVREVGPPAR